jgi:hypothetical protein
MPLFGGIALAWGIRAPQLPAGTKYTFYPGVENVAPGMIPPLYNRSYAISADLEIPRNTCFGVWCVGADGVIIANASFLGGFSLYVEGGTLRHTYSMLGVKIDTLEASKTLPTGKVNVRYEFTADEPGTLGTGGTGRLLVNGARSPRARWSTPSPFASPATPAWTSAATTASPHRPATTT